MKIGRKPLPVDQLIEGCPQYDMVVVLRKAPALLHKGFGYLYATTLEGTGCIDE
jgi:hypothetical protein